jgi:hypothetical protein
MRRRATFCNRISFRASFMAHSLAVSCLTVHTLPINIIFQLIHKEHQTIVEELLRHAFWMLACVSPNILMDAFLSLTESCSDAVTGMQVTCQFAIS